MTAGFEPPSSDLQAPVGRWKRGQLVLYEKNRARIAERRRSWGKAQPDLNLSKRVGLRPCPDRHDLGISKNNRWKIQLL